jgi:hypothetical protein
MRAEKQRKVCIVEKIVTRGEGGGRWWIRRNGVGCWMQLLLLMLEIRILIQALKSPVSLQSSLFRVSVPGACELYYLLPSFVIHRMLTGSV